MSKFTKEMVDDYADKLLIGLTPEENKMVLDEFDIIDEQINILIPGDKEVDLLHFSPIVEAFSKSSEYISTLIYYSEI